MSGTRARDCRRGAGILPGAGVLLACLALFLLGCEENESVSTVTKREGGMEKVFERGPLKVVLWLDNPEPTIADRINLELEMTYEESYRVTPPAFGDKLEQFGISDYNATPPESVGDGKVRVIRSYVLEPFLSGDYTIPAMTFGFEKDGGSEEEKHMLETEELTVKVASLLPEDAADLQIHEVAPPVEIPRKGLPGGFWGMALGGLVALMALIAWLARRKKTKASAPVVRRPAHEIAFDELEALVAENLPEKGELKAFYQRISDILRHYIENRFGLHAPERTTEEFLNELGSGQKLDPAHKPLLGEFLQHCDLVKFAEHQPSRDDLQDTFDSCKNFIIETKEAAPAARAA